MKLPLLLLSVSAICLAQPATADPASIHNGTDWKDTKGNPISAHEGDLARFDGVFYWYGSSYANNPKGKFDIADGPVWNGVQVYRSTDLVNWTPAVNGQVYTNSPDARFFRIKLDANASP